MAERLAKEAADKAEAERLAAQPNLAKGARVKVHVRSGGVAVAVLFGLLHEPVHKIVLTPRIPLGMTGHPGTIIKAVQ